MLLKLEVSNYYNELLPGSWSYLCIEYLFATILSCA